jgi:hypothetical protein
VGLIDRINDWALKRLGRRTKVREVAATMPGIRWRQGADSTEATWQNIQRVVAFQRPTLAGDEITLIFELDDARVMEVNPDWIGWDELVTNLETHLPGARRYVDWLPELLRSTPELTITVFAR